jgi:hypothetical protein
VLLVSGFHNTASWTAGLWPFSNVNSLMIQDRMAYVRTVSGLSENITTPFGKRYCLSWGLTNVWIVVTFCIAFGGTYHGLPAVPTLLALEYFVGLSS